MTSQLLVLAELLIAVAGTGLLLTIVLSRGHRVHAARRNAALLAPHRPLLLAVAAGEDAQGSARASLQQLPDRSWEHVRSAVIAMLARVRGAPAESLVGLLAGPRRGRPGHRPAPLPLGGGPRPRGVPAGPAAGPQTRPRVAATAVRPRRGGPPGDRALAAGWSATPQRPRRSSPRCRSQGGRIGVPAWVAAEALIGMGMGVAPVVRAAIGLGRPGRARRRGHGDRRGHPVLPVPRAPGPAGARPVARGPHRRGGRAGPARWPRGRGPARPVGRTVAAGRPSSHLRGGAGRAGCRRRAGDPEQPAGGAGPPTGRAQRRGAGADRAVGAAASSSTAARGVGPRASVARGALDMARLRGVLLSGPSR